MEGSIVLISSDHVTWVGLRETLRQVTDLPLVDVRHADQAVEVVSAQQPAIVLSGATVAGRPLGPLLARLRAVCPTLKLIVVGEEIADPAAVAQLGQAGIDGYVLWRELSPQTLRCALAAVEAGLRVGSPAAVEAVLAAWRPPHPAVPLTEREQAVLRDLAAGLTLKQIARARNTSERTLKRTMAELRHKLQARTTTAMCVQATREGAIAGDAPASGTMRT